MSGPLGLLKGAVVGVLGRQRANRLSAPYHDWRARQQSADTLRTLPRSGLCLNLGCGHRPLPGFVNVDAARGPHVQVVADLCRPLPFPEASCTAVFCEHVIEHLPREAALPFLSECRRVLEPGGVLRVSTPDAERFLRSYAGDGAFLRHPQFTAPMETPLDRINHMMREEGQHLWVYDTASLLLLLDRAGFSRSSAQEFGRSLHPRMEKLDAEGRAFESLYVEAVK
jgi:predicted SAM-dependent methyltransferase